MVQLDNDWEDDLRPITEEEHETFPKTDKPGAPRRTDKVKIAYGKAKERITGHPAYNWPVPDYDPIDTGPDIDA